MFVYKITNKVSGKSYVGQTIRDVKTRFIEHAAQDRKYPISNAIRKYGKTNFVIETLLETDNIEVLNKKEEEYINKFNTLTPNGYNLKEGGFNKTYSEDSKQKMSESAKKRVREPHSAETKKKMSLSALGKKKSDSHRANLAISKRKQIICYETGENYSSLMEAAEALQVTKGAIWSVINGKLKSVKGLTFSYRK